MKLHKEILVALAILMGLGSTLQTECMNFNDPIKNQLWQELLKASKAHGIATNLWTLGIGSAVGLGYLAWNYFSWKKTPIPITKKSSRSMCTKICEKTGSLLHNPWVFWGTILPILVSATKIMLNDPFSEQVEAFYPNPNDPPERYKLISVFEGGTLEQAKNAVQQIDSLNSKRQLAERLLRIGIFMVLNYCRHKLTKHWVTQKFSDGVDEGNLQKVKEAWQSGADIMSYGSAYQIEPLTWAISHDKFEIANFLIAHGATSKKYNLEESPGHVHLKAWK